MNRTSAAVLVLCLLGCAGSSDDATTFAHVSQTQADQIRLEVETALREAYDLSKPDPVARMISLYPDSGRVVSAAGGQAFTSRDSLVVGIRTFWQSVGRNMRQPRWVWEHMYIDVLSPTAAVVTAKYSVPHLTPRNEPHVIGGVMTEVFQRREGRWVVIQEHLSDSPAQPDSTMPGM